MRSSLFTRKLQYVTVAIIVFIALIPLASKVRQFPSPMLHGISMEYDLPQWSLESFTQNTYQRRFETWALRAQPLWAWSVKIMNQCIYSLTGEVSLDYGTSVQGGNEGYLWQPMYLRSINKNRPPPQKKIFATFRALKKAQTLLAEHKIPLIAVINPNLIALYPEILPQKYQSIQATESSYSVAKRAIEKHAATVLDAHDLLTKAQASFPFRFFEPTGSHWNDVGSCLAVREFAREMSLTWSEPPPVLECESFRMELPPQKAELDLVEIANFMWPNRLYREAPYLTSHPQAHYQKPKKILLIGTSFLFAVEKQLLSHGIADTTTLLFYFRQVRHNGEGEFAPFSTKTLTREELLSYDAIIVDANVAGPGVMGYGALSVINKLLDHNKDRR